MTPDQYWLCKIAEECTEVAQRALKAQQFGLSEIQPGQDLTNLERLADEFRDLLITFDEMMSRIGGFEFQPTDDQRRVRLAKAAKYLELSQTLRQVDPDMEI